MILILAEEAVPGGGYVSLIRELGSMGILGFVIFWTLLYGIPGVLRTRTAELERFDTFIAAQETKFIEAMKGQETRFLTALDGQRQQLCTWMDEHTEANKELSREVRALATGHKGR